MVLQETSQSSDARSISNVQLMENYIIYEVLLLLAPGQQPYMPLFSLLAVKTTVMPLLASWRHISSPIPLFPPVTTAILKNTCQSYLARI
jgi:hypothetical protein